MHRTVAYSTLFAALMLVQVFILNNLTLSVWIAPMIYIAFIILLPVETSPLQMLIAAVVTGAAMDATMGINGLNVIVTTAVAYLRRPIITAMIGSDAVKEGGIPSRVLMGRRNFRNYIIMMIAIHGIGFFVLETLSLRNFGYTLLRTTLSTAATLLLVWIVVWIFSPKQSSRI